MSRVFILTLLTRNKVDKRKWEEFRDSKLLWWINRSLHLFGWAIVLDEEDDGTISAAYPAKVKYRGFSESTEDEGFEILSNYLDSSMDEILKPFAK